MLANNCIFCHIDQGTILGACKFCYSILPWITTTEYRCLKCQKVLSTKEPHQDNLVCTDCDNNNSFNKIFAVFAYQDPVKQLIVDLKFKEKLLNSKFLGNILANCILNSWYNKKSLPDCLITVPLYTTRLRSRGFNQVYEIARYISKITKININNTACRRIKNTSAQMGLEKDKRFININDAFIAKPISYKHIAILDDVVTTGNTIKNLCKAIIKTNKDIKIDIWCICRA